MTEEEYKKIIRDLAVCVSSCNLKNQPEWMEYIVEEFNHKLAAIGCDIYLGITKRGNLDLRRTGGGE